MSTTESPRDAALIENENKRLRAAMRWLYGAYRQECDFPLSALENSLVHLPVIEAADENEPLPR